MTKLTTHMLAACIAMAAASATPAFAADEMTRDAMAPAGAMSKDSMKKDHMAKDGMKKDHMAKDAMKQDGMANDARKKDGMAKEGMHKDGMKKEAMSR
ncbi:pentapeptide MXKDX repeat protein [Delftia tsuruhatensis]|uniref:pentapeptide MXKDX repeat protein n=1 Tax=Delftia tsuruhatensis TaxID=180282 RepID=UPI001E7D6C29|nr:pentapeptide MXKDX repeat protein [Delftia tsuruhatensis]CAB5722435.1 pentapeptide MXKDX repeat protein [Delftia tsuruhatensis]CAC9682437.1 pentapeptide MXKDX repeat protein [Delftia tsuruhatensis]